MFDKFHFFEACSAFTRKLRGVEDSFRMHSTVEVTVRDKNGKVKSHSVQKNLRTNGGADFWNTQLFAVSGINGQAKTAGYMAITTDATAAAATDTTLASEETTNGLARTAQLTPTHSAGATSSVFSNTFTYTGSSSKVIAKVGLFNDTHANGGTLVLETVLASTATVNANGDTITITWTINY
ncbi:Uncharacterised protein [uncultured archaeon]|nr:Uncharacterised protein [uncultured archaeon]